MKHLSWFITLPVTLVVVVFAVSNRTPIEIDLFPLPWRPVLPAYLLVLGSMFIGFLIGATSAWLAGAREAGGRSHRIRSIADTNPKRERGLRFSLADVRVRQF